jgi:hypothetical protein
VLAFAEAGEFVGDAGFGVVRTVTENARTLKFTSQGFEKD